MPLDNVVHERVGGEETQKPDLKAAQEVKLPKRNS